MYFFKEKFKEINILEWKNLKNEIKNFEIIINATSLGLKNEKDFDFNFEGVKNNLILSIQFITLSKPKTLNI